jgi:hypothetical protein
MRHSGMPWSLRSLEEGKPTMPPAALACLAFTRQGRLQLWQFTMGPIWMGKGKWRTPMCSCQGLWRCYMTLNQFWMGSNRCFLKQLKLMCLNMWQDLCKEETWG